ncbi:DUF943 family protein [Cronobacter condimenti]|uniref:DUF943 family protein n=1 Tax=Cronobacter condimenti TaxID=1163710 RepID=UPI0009DA01EE|nr:DUF943 family protein [Cronobacter condimenti]
MLKKVFFTVFIFCLAWLVWRLIAPAKVIRVDGSAIYVENLPMTSKGKISWWKENDVAFRISMVLSKIKRIFM